MTEAQGFALVALLAFAGWGFTLSRLSLALLPQANALRVLQQIVDREDSKVASLAERVLQRQNRGKLPEQSRATTEDGSQEHPLAALFRSPGGSHPDPGATRPRWRRAGDSRSMTRNEKKRYGLWNPRSTAPVERCSRWFERKAVSAELRAAKRLRVRHGDGEVYMNALARMLMQAGHSLAP